MNFQNLQTMRISAILLFLILAISSSSLIAQNLFDATEFKKVEPSQAKAFDQRFDGMIWTSEGFNRQQSVMDRIATTELRARLQARFGHPTKTVKDLIDERKFGRSEGATIQFEYRFVVDGEIPLMLLDINGPFGQGFVWVGGNRWVDRMAQIKRDMTEELMGIEELAEFEDYFYSPEREKWYRVALKNGSFETKELPKSPFR